MGESVWLTTEERLVAFGSAFNRMPLGNPEIGPGTWFGSHALFHRIMDEILKNNLPNTIIDECLKVSGSNVKFKTYKARPFPISQILPY